MTPRTRCSEPLDPIFKSLAHGGRRTLLTRLHERDGRTLAELSDQLPMTRQAVSQHLDVLEGAGLVVTRWRGREKLHYFNAARLLEAYEEWMAPLITPAAMALVELGRVLETGQKAAERAEEPSRRRKDSA